MIDPAQALRFLDGLGPSAIRLGLDRIREALAALGDPQLAYGALHVAGTNGKGSTCAFLDAILRAQGYRVGLYTSPHLERVNERIRVQGQEISDGALARRLVELLERLPHLEDVPPPLTYFEVGTLAALWHFAREEVDHAVLETGLGGRLDATTACAPSVTAITSLSLDHQELLGDTLEQIAREKAGIFKRGVPAVSCAQPPEAQRALVAAAADAGAPLWLEGRDFSLEDGAYRGPTWRLDGLRFGLEGAHQRQNAAVALAALEASGALVTERAIRDGLLGARWPGRLERLLLPAAQGSASEVLLDGAHNPGGVAALARALDALRAAEPARPVQLVFGVLADKAWEQMLPSLCRRADGVHLTPVHSPRSLDPSGCAPLARQHCAQVQVHPGPLEALAAARAAAGPGGLVVVAGSLVLVGAVRGHLVAQQATRR